MFLPHIGNKEGWSLTVLTQNYPSQCNKAKRDKMHIDTERRKIKVHGKGPEK